MSEIVGAKCGINYRLGGLHQCCQGFYNAVKKGRIRMDQERGGWVDLRGPKRGMKRSSWIYRYYQSQRGIPDMTGEDFLLTEICPECGGELQPVSVKNVVAQCDGSEGEE